MTPDARWIVFTLVCGLASAARADDGPDKPRVGLARDQAGYEVTGLSDSDLKAVGAATGDPSRWPRLFRVVTIPEGGNTEKQPPILGRYEVKGGALRFVPRFPLENGVTYVARFDLAALPGHAGAAPLTLLDKRHSHRADREEDATAVVRVSPSADVLPENLLKFYVEFSAPMSRGQAYDRVHLLDASDKPLDLPFLELGEELWNPPGVRLTLLFDPGRIKNGLKPREELGPVLRQGESYTLVVDSAWRDAAGRFLKGQYRRTFRVGPPDVTPPDPKTWAADRPKAGTRDALVVRFPEPLDRGMLGRVLAVEGPDGKALGGRVGIGVDERSWSLTPERPWAPGAYALLADRTLEDRAGNTLGRPFEVDVFDRVDADPTPQTFRLPFAVAGAP